MLSRLVACTPNQEPLKNWAGNLEYSTGNVHYPTTVEQVQEIVRRCSKLRGLGSRHSFNKIAEALIHANLAITVLNDRLKA